MLDNLPDIAEGLDGVLHQVLLYTKFQPIHTHSGTLIDMKPHILLSMENKTFCLCKYNGAVKHYTGISLSFHPMSGVIQWELKYVEKL